MDQYKERLEKIEAQLEALMPKKAGEEWLSSMTDSLASPVPPEMIDRFHEPGKALLQRGGKRWRPLVMVLCCEAAGGKAEDAYPLTPLVEMAHNGSLIIDDIEDRSEERRGGAAVHLVYGDDLSINAGTLMMFNATVLAGRMKQEDSVRFALLDSYCGSLRRLHFGQGLDIQWHRNHHRVPDVPVYLQMCRFKTGALARFAACAGVLLGGGSRKMRLQAAEIWEKAGVGFQILDDVKNLTTGNPGKQRGDDIVEGKKSLPVILYYHARKEHSRELATLIARAGEKGIVEGQEEVEKAIALLEEEGSIREAGDMGLQMLHSAVDELKVLFPSSEPGRLLSNIIESFIENML